MYHVHAKDPIGAFVEREYGQTFEYSMNHVDVVYSELFPHVIWVGGRVNDQGFRFANVKKTVAYVVADEDENGKPVVVRWDIKNHREYA